MFPLLHSGEFYLDDGGAVLMMMMMVLMMMMILLPEGQGWFVGWLLNVPATCECISGTDLLRQIYVLPH